MAEINESSEGAEVLEDEALDNSETFLRYRRGSSRARLTLSAASKMLRRRIPQSGHLMLPRRLWMQTLPAQDCDAVIVFSPSATESTVNFFVNRLKARIPEIIISVRSHQASNAYVLYITTTPVGLLKGGQELRIHKKTKPDYGNGTREFCQNELHIFQGVEEPSSFFTSQERQSIVHHLLNSLRAHDGDEIRGIKFRPGQGIVPCLTSVGLIQQVLPLHDHQYLRKLRKTWVQSFFTYQPLDAIYEYFGAKIAIYFSWLGFYTTSLIVPATIGLIFWIYFWGEDQAKEDKAFVLLALLNVLWGSAWLETWKRRSAEISYQWGTMDYKNELLEDPRPMFKGDLGLSPVTGRVEPIYPTWKRNVTRYLISLPIVVLWVFIVICVMFILLEFQGWWDKFIERRGSYSVLSYGPKFMVAVVISLFDEFSTKLAIYLTDLENYRGEHEHNSHVIIKVAVLRLVNSFFILFYIAFYLQDMDGLKGQLAALFLTRQIVGNIKESCIPYILEQLKLAKLSFELFGALSPSEEDTGIRSGRTSSFQHLYTENSASPTPDSLPRTPSKTRIVGQAEVESNMSKYDDTFEDYLEMFIQFGYVMLFSSAFPLAAMCAFINNLVEIRSDAFKLCCVFQRPFAQSASSIGVWHDMMELMGVLGIIVNCMLIGTSGQVHRMFPEMSTTQTILLIVILEHLMIAIKYSISYVIPDKPEWVAHQIAKSELQRRDTLRKLASSPATLENSEQSSPKSFSMGSMTSTEYVERSVQTEVIHSTINKKTLDKIGRVESFAFPRDFLIPERKSSSGVKSSEIKSKNEITSLGRSVSDCDRVKQCIPKNSKRWNQSCLDNSQLPQPDHFTSKPTPSESLPMLSSPTNYDPRTRLLSFSPGSESVISETYSHDSKNSGDKSSSQSMSSDSIVSTTIREEQVTSLKEDSTTNANVKVTPVTSGLSESSSLTSSNLIIAGSHKEMQDEATPLVSDMPKIGKRHPVKFLKRAQSFSQALKRITDKKKKISDPLRDEYSMLMHREPLGELDLVNLDQLVSLDDLKLNFAEK